jgi:hypothetical protein
VLRVGTGEEGEEDGDGEDEPLHAGLRRAQRQLAASGGGGSRCGRDSGAFAGGAKGRRRRHLVAGDLRHVSTGRRSRRFRPAVRRPSGSGRIASRAGPRASHTLRSSPGTWVFAGLESLKAQLLFQRVSNLLDFPSSRERKNKILNHL